MNDVIDVIYTTVQESRKKAAQASEISNNTYENIVDKKKKFVEITDSVDRSKKDVHQVMENIEYQSTEIANTIEDFALIESVSKDSSVLATSPYEPYFIYNEKTKNISGMD